MNNITFTSSEALQILARRDEKYYGGNPLNKIYWNSKHPLIWIPNLKFDYTKKRIFWFLPNIPQAMNEVEILNAIFHILGSLMCQEWVIMPKNVKKTKPLHPTSYFNANYIISTNPS